jgi:hypothetical protein
MTNTATRRQVDAFLAAVPGFLGTTAQKAINVAVEALNKGLPPVQAVNAAALVLYPDLLTLSDRDRNILLVRALNGLIRSDRVAQLGPHGIFPLQRAIMGAG